MARMTSEADWIRCRGDFSHARCSLFGKKFTEHLHTCMLRLATTDVQNIIRFEYLSLMMHFWNVVIFRFWGRERGGSVELIMFKPSFFLAVSSFFVLSNWSKKLVTARKNAKLQPGVSTSLTIPPQNVFCYIRFIQWRLTSSKVQNLCRVSIMNKHLDTRKRINIYSSSTDSLKRNYKLIFSSCS